MPDIPKAVLELLRAIDGRNEPVPLNECNGDAVSWAEEHGLALQVVRSDKRSYVVASNGGRFDSHSPIEGCSPGMWIPLKRIGTYAAVAMKQGRPSWTPLPYPQNQLPPVHVDLTEKGRSELRDCRLAAVNNRLLDSACREGMADSAASVTQPNGLDGQETDEIPKRLCKAAEQYRQAAEAMGETKPTDKDAYEKLCEAHRREGAADELPDFRTWSRYLREYRRLTNGQKNKPRRGRSGRSIQHRSQL